MKMSLMPHANAKVRMWSMCEGSSAQPTWVNTPSHNAHNPTLPLWVLIYFQINPLLHCLTYEVPNTSPGCQPTDSCLTWHHWSKAGQYCAVCQRDFTPGGGRLARADRRRSCVINHCRNTGLGQAKWDSELHDLSGKNSPEIRICLRSSLKTFYKVKPV